LFIFVFADACYSFLQACLGCSSCANRFCFGSDRMDQNQDIFDKIVENKAFGDSVRNLMLKTVYNKNK